MSRPIKFDNQPTFRTIKIGNIRTYALLAPELLARELAVLKIFPQHSFRCSQCVTEFFPMFFLCRCVVDATFVLSHTALASSNMDSRMTTPSAPFRNGFFFLMAQPPSCSRRGTPLPQHPSRSQSFAIQRPVIRF